MQAFPLVGTLWGVYLFQDYKNAGKRTVVLLGNTYAFYVGAVIIIGLSAR